MSEITAALDETGANDLFSTELAALPAQTASSSASLGPFIVAYTASASLINGVVDLIPPGTIRIADLRLDWSVTGSFGIDLSEFLPDFCIPQVCIDIPCVGTVCTPQICIDWPTIGVTVPLSDFVEATVDLGISLTHTSGMWDVEAVVQGVPNLQFGATTAALLVTIGAAVTPFLLVVPLIGPFLALAVDSILLSIGVAGLTGFLGPILTPFIAGLKVPVYQQPDHYVVLPAEGFDPAVTITIVDIAVDVQNNAPEDELVLTADISA